MRVTAILFFVFVVQNMSNAQILPLDYDTTARDQEIIASGGIDFGGTAVQNHIFSKFIRGGFIDASMKDASFDKHRGINRIGGILGGEIEYRNYNVNILKNKDWGMVVRCGYHIFGGSVYSKDAFGLAMYGNDRYHGDTIVMSGMNLTLMSFQKVGFGLIDGKSKSSVTVNLYNITSRISAGFRTLDIAQNGDGSEMVVTMDGSFERTQSANFNQGLGLGFDADFKAPISWGEGTAYLQFQARNLGVAHLYVPQQRYSVDTTLTYSGFTVDQIVGDNAIHFDSLRVLDTLGIQSTEVNRTVVLPGYIQIGKIVDVHTSKRLQSFFGFRLHPTRMYNPYIYAGMDIKTTDWLSLGVNAGYGGFHGLRGGLYAHARTKLISVGLGTENILGAISKMGSGQSLYLRLRCEF